MAAPSIYANPTGAIGTGGITPPTGGPGNYGYGNAANPMAQPGQGNNPYAISSMTPTSIPSGVSGFQTNLGNAGSTALNPYGLIGTSDYTANAAQFGNELGKIYGTGEGSLLYNYLQSGAGYQGGLTQQAVDATWQAMQHQIQSGLQDIYATEGATGVSPESSTSALATSNFLAQSESTANAIAAQDYYNMWNASQQREAGIIEGTMQGAGSHTANKPGIFGYLGMGLDLASAGSDLWSTLAGIIPGLG